jgi:hypothetical protein
MWRRGRRVGGWSRHMWMGRRRRRVVCGWRRHMWRGRRRHGWCSHMWRGSKRIDVWCKIMWRRSMRRRKRTIWWSSECGWVWLMKEHFPSKIKLVD